MSEKVFAAGFYFDEPSENAPDFVLGNVTISPEAFGSWLAAQKPNDKGYVRLAVKRSQGGKVYAELDTWVPKEPKAEAKPAPKPVDDFVEDDIPF